MYNLLIVDDEIIIAKYIAQIFKNSDLIGNYLLDVKSANSAFEALDIIEQEHIDIVLTDVNMPQINGITMLERIKKKWPHIKVIMMSGYDEFEYVQAVIRNDGVDYILKSEGEEQFLVSIMKAIERLEEELRSEEIIKKASHSLKMANEVLREKVIIDIIEREKYDVSSLKLYFAEIEMPLKVSQPVFLIVGKATMPDVTIVNNSKLYKIKVYVEEHLKKNMKCMSVVYGKRMLWLLQPDNKDNQGTRRIRTMEHIANQLDGIQRFCYDVLGVYVSFSTDQKSVSWEKLGTKFDHLNSTLGMIYATDTGIILMGGCISKENRGYYFNEEEDVKVEEARSAIKRLGMLVMYFDDGTENSFFALFDSLMKPFRTLSPKYDGLRYEAIYMLSAHFLSILNRMQENEDKSVMLADIISKVRNFADWKEVERYFRNLARKIFKERAKDKLTNINRIINFIEKYTLEHLNEDLSLNQFSKLLHYHPSYLSRIFKHATSSTFSNYIANIKLAKAKELLETSNMKIINIATALGFQNASYFTRFFKKHTGLSPQEYRNNYS